MKTKHRYYWRGITRQGKKLSGIIDASSVALVKTELAKQAIIVKKIVKKQPSFFSRKIAQANITLFYRQLALMLKAGIPLIQSFDIVAKSQAHYLMKYLIEDIKKEVEQGLPFSEALGKQPHFFNDLVCNLIAVGEKSGKLDLMLVKAASYKESIESLKKKLQKALAYPSIILLIACFVTLVLLLFVVPQFESLFKNFGAELPLLTQIIIYLSIFFKTYSLALFVLLSALVFGFRRAKQRLSWLSFASDKMLLKLPFLGSLFSKVIIARFTRTLAICLAAGLPLVEALDAVADITSNRVYTKATEEISEELCTGQQMHVAMKNTQLFPPMVVQMVTIGEESGMLELMLTKIADFYEEEVNNSLTILINLLEPMIMAILGIIVGTLVISMYLPIFKLGLVI